MAQTANEGVAHPGGRGILPVVPAELENFETQVGRFLRGELPLEEFRPFRLMHGTYGQRQPDVHMIRVRLPFGSATSEQLRTLGRIAEEYAPLGLGHVTTRQNVQFHFLDLGRVPEIMRLLGRVNLTTREASGNSVRNVTACPLAGVCRKEAFDVTPYAAAYSRYFLRNPVSQNLPRKFKTAFSGCPSDCAVSAINDLGLVAQTRSEGGTERQGFRVLVGGGLSTLPREGKPLYDFVPLEGYLQVAEAVIRVFDRWGERRNRNRARIKFLLADLGLEEFRKRVEGELAQPWAQRQPDLAALGDLEAETPGAPAATGQSRGHSPAGFEEWRRSNVTPQRQAGYYTVTVPLPLGDVTAEQFHHLARLADEFAGGRARTTIEQNITLRWVPEERLDELYSALVRSGLGEAGAGTISDVVACAGTDTCSQAITMCRGLARAVHERVRALDIADEGLKRIQIKISGCPNGCGQHQLGGIGLQGAATRQHGREVPTYDVFLGGQANGTAVRIGKRVAKVAAIHVPQAVERILRLYQERKNAGEPFADFVARLGLSPFAELAADLKQVGPPEEQPEAYIDWGTEREYRVERGEGECAA